MKATSRGLILAGAIILNAAVIAPVYADYITLPVKWSQPIAWDGSQIVGVDYLSNHDFGNVRADDFLCNDARPIGAVRWWGSYVGHSTQRPDTIGFTMPFDVSFHWSTANGNPGIHPFSLPVNGAPLSLQTVLAQQTFVGYDQFGEAVYRYDAYLSQPFAQTPGTEYFLDIDQPGTEDWGWHAATTQNLDWSALAPNHNGVWQTPGSPYDLAFELMVIPEPSGVTLSLLGLCVLGLWQRARKIGG
jgi:hypothetical protein